MKKIITLWFFLSFALFSFSQKLDYDNDSKWVFGLNAGLTWSTTDVENKSDTGWGFLLGRSFNYNYGKKVSFDLRTRYLSGKWYGQDYHTTALLGYNSEYETSAINYIYDTLGYTINNFQTEVREVGLELAIHLNSLRETKGWDPYIFGGLNIVWNQTYGDLLYQDTLMGTEYGYDYSLSGISKPGWNSISDDIFESALAGSVQADFILDNFNIDFMPSLGFGLGYQLGPSFSVGVEHKTTFAMKDVFDGYVNPEKRWRAFENDIYHYTSAYLRFNFRNKNREQHQENLNVNPVFVGSGDCDDPRINISSPSSSSVNVSSRQYKVIGKLEFVPRDDNVLFLVNQEPSTNFAFNPVNGNFESTISLGLGINTITLSAVNSCGTNSKTFSMSYIPCTKPTITTLLSLLNRAIVSAESIQIKLEIMEISSIDQLKVTVNGNLISGGAYDAQLNVYSNRISLDTGKNTIVYTAANNCGATSGKAIVIKRPATYQGR